MANRAAHVRPTSPQRPHYSTENTSHGVRGAEEIPQASHHVQLLVFSNDQGVGEERRVLEKVNKGRPVSPPRQHCISVYKTVRARQTGSVLLAARHVQALLFFRWAGGGLGCVLSSFITAYFIITW